MKMKRRKVNPSPVPAGCFPVYIGPEENEKQRFTLKVEMVSHLLFQILREEAESEYGLWHQGPISLPCNVDLFYKLLAEMDMEMDVEDSSCKDDIKHDARACNNHRYVPPPAALWSIIRLRGFSLNKLIVVDDKKMGNNNSS